MTRRAPPARLRLASTVLLLSAASCAAPAPQAAWVDPAPPIDSVESIVFLIGDAGDALPGRSPVTAKLADEVERWSRSVATDSAVVVFFLGDNVYPEGVRDRDDPAFTEDSLKLSSQVLTIRGEHARRFSARGYFLAGNHDWGGRPGEAGLPRLRNETELVEAFRDEGHLVDFLPQAGAPGPVVLDIGAHARFVVIDTQWWLQGHDPASERRVLGELSRSLRTAGRRTVAVAAHHPFISGGMHGGGGSLLDGFGVLWLLRRAGALVQDLNSAPYRALRTSLSRIFREDGTPLLFAGGHDHSLQVIRRAEAG